MHQKIKYILATLIVITVLSLSSLPAQAEEGEYDNITEMTTATLKESKELRQLSYDFFNNITKAKLAIGRKNESNTFTSLHNAQSDLVKMSKVTESHPQRIVIEAGMARYIVDNICTDYFFPANNDGEILLLEQDKIFLKNISGIDEEDIVVSKYKVRIDPTSMQKDLGNAKELVRDGDLDAALVILEYVTKDLFSLVEEK